jgi:hypothetical protein
MSTRSCAGRYLAALAVLVFMSCPAVARAQGAMTNGANHSGSISPVGDLDQWTFTATAGDAIALSIGEVAPFSAFNPWIRLNDPNGAQVGSSSGALVGQINVTAGLAGTYTVVVADGSFFHDQTGNYLLTLAKTPGAFVVSPGDEGGAATNGANHAGFIHLGDLDQWTFTATAGDAIAVSIGEVAPFSGFDPWIRLRDPSGAQVGSSSGALVGQINVTAGLAGTYTVVVADGSFFHDQTGNYLLTFAKSPGAFVVSPGDEGGPATNGANYAGSIHVGDLDQWAFTATAGDGIAVSIGEVAPVSGFNPWIRLIDPTGAQLGSSSGTLVGQIDVTAGVSGTYTILVADGSFFHDQTGSYLLTFAKSPGAFAVSGAFTDDPLVPGTTLIRSVHVNQLRARIDAVRALYMLGPYPYSASISPGTTVAASHVTEMRTALADAYTSALVTPPTYTDPALAAGTAVKVSHIAELRLAVQALESPPGDQGGTMTNGANHIGSIRVGDLDMWAFAATSGDAIALSIGELAPVASFNPWIRLYDPTGAQVSSSSGTLVGQINWTAGTTGTYTVVVADGSFFHDQKGNYTLTLAKTPGTFVVPADDEGGAMANGVSYPGAIHVGDLDQWTFFATAGHAVTVSIGEVAPVSAFDPWIRLRDPNGVQVGSASGATVAQINVTAGVTGTYTVVVADGSFFHDQKGSYLLTVSGASAPAGAPPR